VPKKYHLFCIFFFENQPGVKDEKLTGLYFQIVFVTLTPTQQLFRCTVRAWSDSRTMARRASGAAVEAAVVMTGTSDGDGAEVGTVDGVGAETGDGAAVVTAGGAAAVTGSGARGPETATAETATVAAGGTGAENGGWGPRPAVTRTGTAATGACPARVG